MADVGGGAPAGAVAQGNREVKRSRETTIRVGQRVESDFKRDDWFLRGEFNVGKLAAVGIGDDCIGRPARDAVAIGVDGQPLTTGAAIGEDLIEFDAARVAGHGPHVLQVVFISAAVINFHAHGHADEWTELH